MKFVKRLLGVLRRIPFCIKTNNKLKNVCLLGSVRCQNKNIKCLGRVTFCDGVKLLGKGKIVLGNNTIVGDNTIIFSAERDEVIEIGNDVMIAANCYIVNATHNTQLHNVPMKEQGITSAPIIIQNDVWICEGVTILYGVSIGGGALLVLNH